MAYDQDSGIVQFDRMGPRDYHLCHFQAMCALARSVKSHLRALVDATGNSARILEGFDTYCVDRFPEGGQRLDPNHYLSMARKIIRTEAETYEPDSDLYTVLNAIADRATPLTAAGVIGFFRDAQRAGRELAENCLDQWGGEKSKRIYPERFKRAIDLHFVSGGRWKIFHLYFDPVESCIVVPVGMQKGMLRRCLNLDFYFFHEYLSHVFPLYDDDAGAFSEGYMVAIEEEFFRFSGETFIPGMLLTRDWEQHRRYRFEHGESTFYDEQQEVAGWIIRQCHNNRARFPGICLELAATDRNEVGKRFHQLFLGRLRKAPGSVIRSKVCGSSLNPQQLLDLLPSVIRINY